MENESIEDRIKGMKSAATNQTEYVQGLIMLLLINCKTLDEVIENLGNDDLKEVVVNIRKDIPELLMAVASEAELINKNKNQLS